MPPAAAPRNEIKAYINGRYMCAHEAAWRINENVIHHNWPNVIRLRTHLEGEQPVHWTDDDQMRDIAEADPPFTELMGWFQVNAANPAARTMKYTDFVTQYWWDKRGRQPYQWTLRRRASRAIGRMYE